MMHLLWLNSFTAKTAGTQSGRLLWKGTETFFIIFYSLRLIHLTNRQSRSTEAKFMELLPKQSKGFDEIYAENMKGSKEG